MKKRFLTGVVLLAILVPALLFLNWVWVAVAVFMTAAGVFELVSAFGKKHQLPRYYPWLFAGGAAAFSAFIHVALLFERLPLVMIAGAGFVFALLAAFLAGVFAKRAEGAVAIEMTALAGWVFIMLTLATALAYFRPFGVTRGGKWLAARYLIYVLVIVVCNDAFAYFFGSAFGKHKLAPTVSPHKSWEGAVAGLVIGTALATLAAWGLGIADGFAGYAGIGLAWALVIIFGASLVLSIGGQLGDLLYSKIKRALDVKDYSGLLPGHGGILDRFDSFSVAGSLLALLLLIGVLI